MFFFFSITKVDTDMYVLEKSRSYKVICALYVNSKEECVVLLYDTRTKRLKSFISIY